MALLVLDASVVIAHLQSNDSHHASAVAALTEWRRADFVLPASAYAELLVGAYQGGPRAVDVVERFVAELPIRVEPITAAVARRAASLRARHRGMPLPDALVIATGEALEADGILTADRSWLKWSRRVRAL